MADSTPSSTPIAKQKRAPLLGFMLLVVAVAALVAGVYYWEIARFYEHTDDAYVSTNVVAVTPQVTGTVRAVNVRDTEHVESGQVLVELDASDAQIGLEGAEAELARTVREVRTVYANNDTLAADIAVHKADLLRAETDVHKAQDDYATRQSLISTGAVGKEELKHAEAALSAANAAVAAAHAAIGAAAERLTSNRTLTEGISIEQHPAVAKAAAHVRDAYLAWSRSRILAPVSGEVAKRAVQVGQRVQPGMNLLALVPLDKVWVEANFKEVQLRHMRLGQPVIITADLYGGNLEYRGHIAGFGAGTGSVFALLPAQNATGNWIKIVQRVPVRIDLDKEQLRANPLRVGLSMQVEVDVHDSAVHDSAGLALESVPVTKHVSSTDIFDGQRTAADRRVAEIIAANLGSSKAGLVAGP